MGVSTSTAGQDFGAQAAALFTKPSDNKEDHNDGVDGDHVSNTQSNHGSEIPDFDGVDLGSEILSQEWNLALRGMSLAPVQDGGDGSGSPDGSKDSSIETKVMVRLCSI